MFVVGWGCGSVGPVVCVWSRVQWKANLSSSSTDKPKLSFAQRSNSEFLLCICGFVNLN